MNCWQKLTDMEDLPKVNSELQKRYKDTWLQFRSNAWNETKFGMFFGNNHEDSYYAKIIGEGTVTLPFKHSEPSASSVVAAVLTTSSNSISADIPPSYTGVSVCISQPVVYTVSTQS